MKIEIELSESFEKDFKRLKKRYRSLSSDLRVLKNDLYKNPYLGVDLGNGVYKIRIAIKSKGRGKSGSGRIVAHHTIFMEVSEHLITLLTIYDKSEKDNITDMEIIKLLKKNGII
jgi:hypothetical protein